MEKLFIPFELALLAKEKGFNCTCIASFTTTQKLTLGSTFGIKNSDLVEGVDYIKYGYCVTAPLYQQIVDWFRDTHKIFIEVEWSNFGKELEWCFKVSAPLQSMSHTDINGYLEYYDCLNEAIKKAFTFL